MTALVYQDFDLAIEANSSDSSRYRVRVSSLAAGQASAEFTLPFSVQELEILFLRLGRPRRGVRAIGSPEMKAAQAFGSQLFTTVFTGAVQSALVSSLNLARQQGQGVRIRLRLTDAPALADLPWEFLYDPTHHHFLAYSTTTPLVRFLDLPHTVTPLAVQPPLKVLVMIANPRDYNHSTLDVEDEWRKVQSALADLQTRELVQVTRLETATLSALQRQLRRDQYHIFHFVGHGGFDQQTQSGVLLLEDEEGRGRMVSGHYLGALLRDHFSLRLALLNACEGARSSRFDPFAGVAQHLVQQGIPAVIAMQFEITDQAAITLSHEFYNALADNYSVEAALSEARKALYTAGNDIEWGTPVLYLRAQRGELFDLTVQPVRSPVTALPPHDHTEPQRAAQSAVINSPQAATAAKPQVQLPPVAQPGRPPDSKLQPSAQSTVASTIAPQMSATTKKHVPPMADHALQHEPKQKIERDPVRDKVVERVQPLPLSAWNPLHYLKLLWWIFITPQSLQAYLTKDGHIDKARLQPMGGYLASLLTWLPLLLTTLALALGRLPSAAGPLPAPPYWWISLGLVTVMLLGGWLDKYESSSVAFGVAFVLAFVLASVAVGNEAGGVVFVVAFGVAISVAGGVVFVVAFGVAISVAGGVVLVVALIVAVSVTGNDEVSVAGGVAVGVAFVVAFSVAFVVEQVVKKGAASWLGYSCFGALVLAYGFLIWYCYLGGYQWFS